MNRKIPVRKNYFSFLSNLSVKRILPIGLFTVTGVTVAVLCWLLVSRIDMDASAVFGISVLVISPLIVLVIVSVALEKLLGFSCLRGVEWIGKYTLALIDWSLMNIRSLLGLEHQSIQASSIPESEEMQQQVSTQTDDISLIDETELTDFLTLVKTEEPEIIDELDESALVFAAKVLQDPLAEKNDYKHHLFSEEPQSASELETLTTDSIGDINSQIKSIDPILGVPRAIEPSEAMDSQSLIEAEASDRGYVVEIYTRESEEEFNDNIDHIEMELKALLDEVPIEYPVFQSEVKNADTSLEQDEFAVTHLTGAIDEEENVLDLPPFIESSEDTLLDLNYKEDDETLNNTDFLTTDPVLLLQIVLKQKKQSILRNIPCYFRQNKQPHIFFPLFQKGFQDHQKNSLNL